MKFEAVKKVAETGFKVKDLSKISRVDSISPPSVFIGSKLRYPEMNVGILSPLEKEDDVSIYDDAKEWANKNYGINDVLKLRNSLLNSRFRTRATDVRLQNKFVEIAQEVAIASKPVDIEIELKNRVKFGKSKDQVLTPHGMNANLGRAKITSNVKVHQKVDRAMNDEIKASEGVGMLYKNNIDEYALSKILSVGVMGLKKNKKLVPTRWSITATDDIIGKQLLEEVRDYHWIEDFELFYGEFMGNCYLIMCFPNVWSYELFELYLPGSSWNPGSEIKAATDYESFSGRKNYATDTAGGYYAARLPILKYLKSIRRQASVLAIRLELPTYWAALGVWVVRESVKKALANGMKFSSREEMIEGVKQIGKKKYNFDVDNILVRSKLLKERKEQKNLRDYFSL